MPAMYQMLAQECDNEVLAIFAYMAYKRHKAEALQAILDIHAGPPTQQELDMFYLTACTPSMRDMYVQQAQILMKRLVGSTLEQRRRELEQDFFATKVGRQLETLQEQQKTKRTWRGWAAEVSGNLAVNFVTILVIAALLFGFRGLDNMLGEFGRDSGVLRK
jgi:hypothetical protein